MSLCLAHLNNGVLAQELEIPPLHLPIDKVLVYRETFAGCRIRDKNPLIVLKSANGEATLRRIELPTNTYEVVIQAIKMEDFHALLKQVSDLVGATISIV